MPSSPDDFPALPPRKLTSRPPCFQEWEGAQFSSRSIGCNFFYQVVNPTLSPIEVEIKCTRLTHMTSTRVADNGDGDNDNDDDNANANANTNGNNDGDDNGNDKDS